LAGWARVSLKPGESKTVSIAADTRLLASFSRSGWSVHGGVYDIAVGPNASSASLRANLILRQHGELRPGK